MRGGERDGERDGESREDRAGTREPPPSHAGRDSAAHHARFLRLHEPERDSPASDILLCLSLLPHALVEEAQGNMKEEQQPLLLQCTGRESTKEQRRRTSTSNTSLSIGRKNTHTQGNMKEEEEPVILPHQLVENKHIHEGT